MRPGKIYSTAIVFVLLLMLALPLHTSLAKASRNHVDIVVRSNHTASLEATGMLSPVAHPYSRGIVNLDFEVYGDDLYISFIRRELYNAPEEQPPNVTVVFSVESEAMWNLNYFYDGENLVIQASQTQTSWNSINKLTFRMNHEVRLILSTGTGILRAETKIEVETLSANYADVLAELAELYKALNSSAQPGWFQLLELVELSDTRNNLLYSLLKASFLVDVDRSRATSSPEDLVKLPASGWARGRYTASAVERSSEKIAIYAHSDLRAEWTEKTLIAMALGDFDTLTAMYNALGLAWDVAILPYKFYGKQPALPRQGRPGLLELTMLAGFISDPLLRGARGQLYANISSGEIVYWLKVWNLPIPPTSSASDTRWAAQRMAELVVVLTRLAQDPEPLVRVIMDRTVTLEPGDLGVADISPSTVKFRDLYTVSIQWAEEIQETAMQPPVAVGESQPSTRQGSFSQTAFTAVLLAITVAAALAVAWLGTARRKESSQ